LSFEDVAYVPFGTPVWLDEVFAKFRQPQLSAGLLVGLESDARRRRLPGYRIEIYSILSHLCSPKPAKTSLPPTIITT
jgi:hypothetical protein